MATINIDLTQVNDWPSFHAVFARAMGFPDFYGKNMNAWEDCMMDISRPGQPGMTGLVVPPAEDIVLKLYGFIDFRNRVPEVCASFLDSTAHVNQTKVNIPSASKLNLLPL